MSAIITDVLDDNIDARKANAAVNAGGKLLKVVEMQHKYGVPKPKGEPRELYLVPGRNS